MIHQIMFHRVVLVTYLTGVFYVRNLQISLPPFYRFYKHPSNTFFCNRSAQFFCAFRGKFDELGCKIYTPYGFFMLFNLFLYLLLIFYVHFPQFFVEACYFPLFGKVGSLQTSPWPNVKYRSLLVTYALVLLNHFRDYSWL